MVKANIGGDKGFQMTRIAFAVMLKFSDLVEDFIALQDDVLMEQEMTPDESSLIAFIKDHT
jgi:hypothetical protein